MATVGLGSQSEVAALLAQAKNLHQRVLFVLFAFLVFRLGTHIPLPGVDVAALGAYQSNLQQGLFGLFNMFSGGALSRMAVFALGIFPYVTASIIFQLFAAAYPTLGELQKEGEIGRRKINQYTRYLTVVLAFVQGFGLATGVMHQTAQIGGQIVPLVANPGLVFQLQTALTITAGTFFLMWLSDQINVRGIGNGGSLIIYAGIVAEFPKKLFSIIELARTGAMSGFMVMAILAGAVALVLTIVFFETATRRIAIQYPKRQGMFGAVNMDANHLPLKLNMAGIYPPIFASSLLMVPLTVSSYFPQSAISQFVGAWFTPGNAGYLGLLTVLIFFFSFFWVANVSFKGNERADDLKKSGAFIPGIRPGAATAKFLDDVATRLTFMGALYLIVICTLPDLLHRNGTIPFQIGGTSLLIIVSVTMDTVARIQSALIAQKYESLIRKSNQQGGRNLLAGARRK